ncbi:helix-turn-helix transcriptional regulator [Thalassiella azotivora]
MTGGDWTFLTNHGHVLVCLARYPDERLKDVADRVGVTERAVQGIVRDLEDGGYLVRERVGRRNRYVLAPDARLRHPLEEHVTVGALLDLVRRPR